MRCWWWHNGSCDGHLKTVVIRLIAKQDVNIMKVKSDRGEAIRLEQLRQVEGEYRTLCGR